jgi:hypothetical protein
MVHLTKTIIDLSNSYDESMWRNYSECFRDKLVNDEDLRILPRDILIALVGLLGIDETKIWIKKELKL